MILCFLLMAAQKSLAEAREQRRERAAGHLSHEFLTDTTAQKLSE
jgi:hypothetical protein